MFVLKRSGERERVCFDKITERISKLCEGLNAEYLIPEKIAQKVVEGVYDGVCTSELDILAAETCAYMSQTHPDFSLLAARIAVSNLQKQTTECFGTVCKQLYYYKNEVGNLDEEIVLKEVVDKNDDCRLLSDEYFSWVMQPDILPKVQAALDYKRDFGYDYFGFKTLEKSYFLKVNGRIVERPQHLLMRCALGIHMADKNIEQALETYDLLSKKYFTHATPSLFNAGTPRNQMSSCFLLSMAGDSIDGIYDTLKRCAKISKCAGGIGVAISNIRAAGSYIRGTNGISNGLVPMLRVFNDTARYVDQGGGRRKGAFAMYLEPWHLDVFDFLELKKNHGKEEARARDLFYALWVPDLFMKRVMANDKWTLFCPDETRCPKSGKTLQDLWGDDFEKRYCELEEQLRVQEENEKEGAPSAEITEGGPKTKKLRAKSIPAQSLWSKITESQMETGVPYICYKDAANRKSNQQNLGTIRCSNLCTEIFEYTSPDEVAVCNLASIALPMYVKDEAVKQSSGADESGNAIGGESPLLKRITTGTTPPAEIVSALSEVYDFDKLRTISKVVTRNLNKVIDVNYYPIQEARNSNMKHRPIGIGVQGLADAFMKLKLPFESDAARELNRLIFETIYFGACEASMELAKVQGPYTTFAGSPASAGNLQFDLWGVKPTETFHDWATLKEDIKKNGMRNSLLLAPMPTASTAQILGNNESFEPYTQNIYVRRVLSGEFVQTNRHLLKDLIDRGIWNDALKTKLIVNNGSVQNIPDIPQDIKEMYGLFSLLLVNAIFIETMFRIQF